MAFWEINIDGAGWVSFASLGISGAVRQRGSLVTDTFSFSVLPESWTGATLWAGGETVKVRRDGAAFFEGRAADPGPGANGGQEAVRYRVDGPWYWFEQITYRQLRKHRTVAAPTVAASIYKSRCALLLDSAGAAITTGAQISAVATYCASASGSKFSVGSVFAGISLWPTETRAAKCSQVVRDMMAANPDAVAWFDYSASPPSFRAARRADLTELELPAEASEIYGVTRCSAAPRSDLQSQGVLIEYETAHEYDGASYVEVTLDSAPEGLDGDEPGVLVVPVDLKGVRITMQKQPVETLTIPEDGASDTDARQWWIDHDPLLKVLSGTASAANLNFATADAGNDADGFIWRHQAAMGGDPTLGPEPDPEDWSTDPGDYPRELTGGALAPWMADTAGIRSAPITCRVSVRIPIATLRGAADSALKAAVVRAFSQPYPAASPTHMVYQAQVTVTGTNATTKTYSKIATAEAGEEIPTGLAAAVHATASHLQYEGEWAEVWSEAGGVDGVGKKVNLTGGDGAWETMGAVVFQQTERIDQGETVIRFGPNGMIGTQDVVRRIEAFRRNMPAKVTTEELTEGEAPKDGAVDLEGISVGPQRNAVPAPVEVLWRGGFFVEWDDKLNDGVWVYPGNIYNIRTRAAAGERTIPTCGGSSLTIRRKLAVTPAASIYCRWSKDTDNLVTDATVGVGTNSQDHFIKLAAVAVGGNVTREHVGNIWTSSIPDDPATSSIPPP